MVAKILSRLELRGDSVVARELETLKAPERFG
jgi:hypothetical protein